MLLYEPVGVPSCCGLRNTLSLDPPTTGWSDKYRLAIK